MTSFLMITSSFLIDIPLPFLEFKNSSISLSHLNCDMYISSNAESVVGLAAISLFVSRVNVS